MRMASVSLALSLAILPFPAGAPPTPQKDAVVVLKIPLRAFKAHEKKFLGTVMSTDLVATIEDAPPGVAVNGDTAWQTAGFPSLVQMKVTKLKTDSTGLSEVELKSSKTSLKLKVMFKGNLNTGFPRVFASPSDADAYRDEAYKALAAKFFTGPLAQLPTDKQQRLVTFAHITAQGTTMGSETYKEKLYLVVDVGEDENVYNELRMNQTQRVARVLNDRLLLTLKAFAKLVEDAKDIQGLKLELEIPHRSFAKTAAAAVNDKVELYAPAEQIKKFADADTTSQQFIDGCVVIVNDNRVSVPLAN
jgi:hypothetical protein